MSEMTPTPYFDEEQRANMRTQRIQDAEFLTHGGEYDEIGRLVLSDESVGKIYFEEFKKTPEYQRVLQHQIALDSLRTDVGFSYLDYPMSFHRNEDVTQIVQDQLQRLRGEEVDLPESVNSRDTAQAAIEALGLAERNLLRGVSPLASRSDLHFGAQVRVLRNRDHDHPDLYYQDGWTISDITVKGEIIATRGDAYKKIPVATIIADNPAPTYSKVDQQPHRDTTPIVR